VDAVHVVDRQAGQLAQASGQRALARTGYADDHDPLHSADHLPLPRSSLVTLVRPALSMEYP